KSKNALLLAAAQSLVQPADSRAGGVTERQNRPLRVARHGRAHVRPAVALRPREHGLDFKSLPLPIFVIGRDSLRRPGLDVIDAEHVATRVNAGHLCAASVAPLGLMVRVRTATLVANIDRCGGEATAVLGADTGRQLGLPNPVGAALVIDEAARSKLRNCN